MTLSALARPTQEIDEGRATQVKAAFLPKFVGFVTWPDRVFVDETSPIVIGVLGEDPFGSVLDGYAEGKQVRGRSLRIRRIGSDVQVERIAGQLTTCHALFICSSEDRQLTQIIASLDRRPVLTISDIDDFAGRGGMIELVLDRDEGTIGFNINRGVTEEAELRMSAKLLRLAKRIVESRKS